MSHSFIFDSFLLLISFSYHRPFCILDYLLSYLLLSSLPLPLPLPFLQPIFCPSPMLFLLPTLLLTLYRSLPESSPTFFRHLSISLLHSITTGNSMMTCYESTCWSEHASDSQTYYDFGTLQYCAPSRVPTSSPSQPTSRPSNRLARCASVCVCVCVCECMCICVCVSVCVCKGRVCEIGRAHV